MTSMRARACGLLLLSGIASVQAGAQSEPRSMEVAPFRSVELRNGVHAILRYGQTPRLIFLKGSPDDTRVTIAAGGELVIEKRKSKSGRRYELEIEIVAPELDRVVVAHGGVTQSRGTFPRQAALAVTVDNGGTIDLRSMSAGTVTASVISGGRIFVKPLTAMTASVVQGGNITYWGDAPVTQSIQHGGVIEMGTPWEADTPLPELTDAFAPVPPIPAPPPVEGRRHPRR